MTGPLLDCIVVGGGPAGLTAALYLARFRRRVCVIDAGASRAAWIPVSHNQPLFPGGISGTEILGRMKEHLTHLGSEILADKAIALARIDQGFLVELAKEAAAARTLLLATGVVNHQPDMSAQLHGDAVAAGLIRYCPICDGFEAKHQKIVVLGRGPHGVREALFLRTYSQDVTLFCDPSAIDDRSSTQLAASGISLIEQPVACLTVDQAKILIQTASGRAPPVRHPLSGVGLQQQYGPFFVFGRFALQSGMHFRRFASDDECGGSLRCRRRRAGPRSDQRRLRPSRHRRNCHP